MSYQFPQQQAPRRKSGGMFFLILFGVGAFLLFSRMGNRPAVEGPGQRQQPIPGQAVDSTEYDYTQREDIFESKEPKSKIGQKMPSTGGTGAAADWSMEGVEPKSKPDNDWAIE